MNGGEALPNYDHRYAEGYMADFEELYEWCRLVSIRQILGSRELFPEKPELIVDIGCGQGRYLPIIREAFPTCRIVGVDLSTLGLSLARKRVVETLLVGGIGEAIPLADNIVDLVFSVETLEHVADARAMIREWHRIVKPGGKILFTTPCANRFSLEWTLMALTRGFEESADGFGRFAWDEPGHLRRLTSRHIRDLFAEVGFSVLCERFRTHFFTTLSFKYLERRHKRLSRWIASLDWRFLRWFPNGASMLVVGRKPQNASISSSKPLISQRSSESRRMPALSSLSPQRPRKI